MIEYKKMTPEHVSGVAALEKVCFPDPWSEKSIASEVSNPLSLWLVATQGEKVVGYVGSQSVLDGADMMNIAVDPDYRNAGIATQLIVKLIDLLKDKRVVCLCLEVRISNESAIALYEKMGFVPVGRRLGYYRNPREDAYIMRKEW